VQGTGRRYVIVDTDYTEFHEKTSCRSTLYCSKVADSYDDQVQALEDQARALEKSSKDIREAIDQLYGESEPRETAHQGDVAG
jgi:hypothetical protein